MEEEIWKDIPGYEGIYQASNLGEVKSLDRYVASKTPGSIRHIRGVVLKPKLRNGYLFVDLCRDNKRSSPNIHQIVCLVFMGHTFESFANVINHIDGNKSNNRIDNLEIISQRENVHAYFKKAIAGYRFGACNDNGRFRSSIYVDGRKYHLGCFEKREDAHAIYSKAEALILSGEFKSWYNSLNKTINFTSKYRGISYSKTRNSWVARIIDGRNIIFSSYHKTEVSAIDALSEFVINYYQ